MSAPMVAIQFKFMIFVHVYLRKLADQFSRIPVYTVSQGDASPKCLDGEAISLQRLIWKVPWFQKIYQINCHRSSRLSTSPEVIFVDWQPSFFVVTDSCSDHICVKKCTALWTLQHEGGGLGVQTFVFQRATVANSLAASYIFRKYVIVIVRCQSRKINFSISHIFYRYLKICCQYWR